MFARKHLLYRVTIVYRQPDPLLIAERYAWIVDPKTITVTIHRANSRKRPSGMETTLKYSAQAQTTLEEKVAAARPAGRPITAHKRVQRACIAAFGIFLFFGRLCNRLIGGCLCHWIPCCAICTGVFGFSGVLLDGVCASIPDRGGSGRTYTFGGFLCFPVRSACSADTVRTFRIKGAG